MGHTFGKLFEHSSDLGTWEGTLHNSVVAPDEALAALGAPRENAGVRRRAGRRKGSNCEVQGPQGPVTIRFASPEDTLLHKLVWYRLGNEISDRQWGDILGVFKVQGTLLDDEYTPPEPSADGESGPSAKLGFVHLDLDVPESDVKEMVDRASVRIEDMNARSTLYMWATKVFEREKVMRIRCTICSTCSLRLRLFSRST